MAGLPNRQLILHFRPGGDEHFRQGYPALHTPTSTSAGRRWQDGCL